MRLKNPIKAFVELFQPIEVSPLKDLPVGHPQKQYCYTLVGFNGKPSDPNALINFGFLGQIKGSNDYIITNGEILWKNINIVVQIGNFYNIAKIRKYYDTGKGIEWESSSRDVYRILIDAQLFDA